MALRVGTTDRVWRAQGTSPSAIEAAVRGLLVEIHADNEAYVPTRVLNLVVVVDKEYSGEIANRLRHVGRSHPSRTIVCSVEPRRTALDAVATIAAPSDVGKDEPAPARETILVTCGPRHLKHLDRIVDPLVVTDLPTVVWSPHGYPEAVDSLLPVSQTVLLDSVDEPDAHTAVHRALELCQEAYVVDLAWLRSTPWRERIAGTFDPPKLQPELRMLSRITVHHHPESMIAGVLLVGWLASRLGWQLGELRQDGRGVQVATAHARRQDVAIRFQPEPAQQVRGLAGVELESASGRWLRFDRGPGGLHARYRRRERRGQDVEREWTILGASRGESGILGEGLRQALLRDWTYRPALEAAGALVG